MSNQSGVNPQQDNKKAISTSLRENERKLLTFFSEMSERDQRYILRVAEAMASASG